MASAEEIITNRIQAEISLWSAPTWLGATSRGLRDLERMMQQTSKRRILDPETDLSSLDPEEAQEFLAEILEPDPRRGVLKIFDERYVILRPEMLVNIQRQLEQTVGASTKGFLYLAGERSAEERLHIIRALVGDLSLDREYEESRKSIADVLALIGWGRYSIVEMDRGTGRLVVTLEDSPIAGAYGPSAKPVCHLLAGVLAGVGRKLLAKELLCEEVSCAAQGRPRCEFELNPRFA